VGFDFHGLDPPVSNQRPKDAPGMTVSVMLAAWASLDPLHYGLIVDDNRQVACRAKQEGRDRRELRQRHGLAPVV
jgi:hypothetical protein